MHRLIGSTQAIFLFAGGAPLSPETHEFVRTVMGCPILQAYGLTETCANTTAMDIHDNSTGAVGPPNQGVHIKLVNWEEGNYRWVRHVVL